MSEPVRILVGDVLDGLRTLPAGSVHCAVTSPPYWGLRDYGVEGQIGLEPTPEEYIDHMVAVAREVWRVLRDDGTFWLNVGDSYAGSWRGGSQGDKGTLEGAGEGQQQTRLAREKQRGSVLPAGLHEQAREAGAVGRAWVPAPRGMKQKDLCLMPWRLVLALLADGWWLRSAIVWAKKSPMPESVTDRPTSAWEPIFLLARSDRYFYDAEAVREVGATGSWDAMPPIGGAKHAGNNGNATYSGDRPASDGTRNLRNVWHLGPEPYAEAHFATFPTEIPRRAIKAGTSEKGCCPACGAPWRRIVAREKLTRHRPNAITKRDGADGTGNHCANTVAGVATRTTGWEPTCQCPPADPVPCTVLDPFLGSGTTVAVARELGRHGVGCELNPEYAALARIRIGKAEKPSTFVDPRAKDAPLFA